MNSLAEFPFEFPSHILRPCYLDNTLSGNVLELYIFCVVGFVILFMWRFWVDE
jgi:hypothetical protein